MLPPLPERMRPQKLSDYVGQRHLVGPGCILRTMMDSGALSSFILWGPPGVGKTTLARIIANTLDREFYTLSAVSSGVKDVRDVIDAAKGRSLFSAAGAPILFIDEIHRFNKAQQDALLGAVEAGTVVLIGATTENPSFEVITPLLSRCQVFVLKSLEVQDLQQLLDRALTEDVVLKERKIEVRETDALFRHSGGDARKLLNILEIVVDAQLGKSEPAVIDNRTVTECLQENVAIYDKGGEMHYDIISAFIKAINNNAKLVVPFYKRLGEDVVRMKSDIKQYVSRSVIQGKTWFEIADGVANGMNSPFNRSYNLAVRIARTEGHKVQEQATFDSMLEAKDAGADVVKQWDATLDDRTREAHAEADGQIRAIDEPFDVDGEQIMMAGEGSAENCINCRCHVLTRATWNLDEAELNTLKQRADFFGLDKTRSFNDYMSKYLDIPTD